MLTKADIQAMSDDELLELREKCSARIVEIKNRNGYSDLQCACVRTAASGEMGNMFVICSQYGITATEYKGIVLSMRAANKVALMELANTYKEWWAVESEKQNRFFFKRYGVSKDLKAPLNAFYDKDTGAEI